MAWYGQIKPARIAGIRDVGPLEVAAKITAPVLGLYGEADQGIPAADVKEMEATLKAAGKTAEFALYGDAPHGRQEPPGAPGRLSCLPGADDRLPRRMAVG